LRRLVHRASGCLGTLCGSSPLIVDFIAYASRLGASARRTARRRLLRLVQARRRLHHLRRASGCLGTSRGSSSTTSPRVGSLSTSSPTPRVQVPRHVARLVVGYFASRRLAVGYFASRRLVRHASGCLGTKRGSSRSSSSTNSTMPHIRVPRHVARLVSPLVVDYFAYAARPGASARRAARHTTRRRLLRASRLHLAATMALLQPRRASRLLVSRQHWLYFEYAARCRDVVFRSHRVDHSSRLVFQTSREWQSRPQQLVGINSD
jgi:hypothetical protein